MRLLDSFDFTFEVPLGLFKISDDIHTAVAVATCDTFDRAAQVEAEPLDDVNDFYHPRLSFQFAS
jgi:hypothetical protein